MLKDSPDENEKRYILEKHRSILNQQGSSNDNDDTEGIFEDKRPEPTTGLGYASFNYINSILGSGVIGMAYALHQAGFVAGLLLLALVALVTDYSLILMVRSAHLSNCFSYQSLMEAAFGSAGFYLLTCLQFVYPFIAMVSYNIVVGDTMTKVMQRLFDEDSIFASRQFIVATATLFITLPLCLMKNLAKLAKASFLSLLFIAFILIAIFIRFITFGPQVPSTPQSWQVFNWQIIPAIGIMAFAFMCHHNVFLLYHSIEDPSQEKWDKVTHYSVGASLGVAAVFAIFGYATFTSFSQGDLLENYCLDDDLMNFARFAFCGTILLTFPIECLVTKTVLINAFGLDYHYISTITIVISAFLISITTDCLGIVLELNGVISAVPLAFILPALSYLKLEEGKWYGWKKLPALGVSLFGFVVAGFGLAQILIHVNDVGHCAHGGHLPYCQPYSSNLTR